MTGAAAEHARRQALRRLADALHRIPVVDRSPIACAPGCHFCCHLRVMTTPVEVFGLLDFIESHATADALAAFRQRLDEASASVREVDPKHLLSTNIPCPVLVDGHCSAYAARPFNCRSYHSLDRDACERAFMEPADPAHTHPQFVQVARVHEAAQAAMIAATGSAGVDSRQYELVTALHEAAHDPGARQRFESGARTVFLRAVEVLM